MMSKVLSTISFLGMMGLVGYEYIQAIELQQRFQSFVAKGPRFTAADGQALCERVQKLEPQPQPCAYAPKP